MNLRYLWRSVVSVLVLSFALFPTLCYASETVTTNSGISYDIMPLDYTEDSPANGQLNSLHYFSYINSSTGHFKDNLLGTLEGVGSNYTGNITADFDKSILKSSSRFAVLTWFTMNDGTLFVDKGDSFNLQITGITYSYREHGEYLETYLNGSTMYGDYTFGEGLIDTSECTEKFQILLRGSSSSDSVRLEFDSSEITFSSDGTFILDVDIEGVSFDVYRIGVVHYFTYDFSGSSLGEYQEYTRYMQIGSGFKNSTFSITLPDETNGLLGSIIEWLRSIKNGITDVFDSITALPGRIWSLFEEGLKSLFVPSESDMIAYKDKWDELLSQRFGVVYQSGTIITDTLGTITEQSAQGTINLPATTISFAETDFTFGGYDVPVVPQGFEWLVEIIKGLIDIVVTVAFINAMRTKYDQLMRG